MAPDDAARPAGNGFGRWSTVFGLTLVVAGSSFAVIYAIARLADPPWYDDRPWYEAALFGGMLFGLLFGSLLATLTVVVERFRLPRVLIVLGGFFFGFAGYGLGLAVGGAVSIWVAYGKRLKPIEPASA